MHRHYNDKLSVEQVLHAYLSFIFVYIPINNLTESAEKSLTYKNPLYILNYRSIYSLNQSQENFMIQDYEKQRWRNTVT
ncbi:31696_t:CDS:2 [Gigaspora margarita]|uniref:31696_t:CDS:1 n=1 Tax=Gigaspora margarita TaxID=4874 RepID=A0ABN7UK67_GIGMA|nr:31696_t:CDS:2 [Gigaspora margarita]